MKRILIIILLNISLFSLFASQVNYSTKKLVTRDELAGIDYEVLSYDDDNDIYHISVKGEIFIINNNG